MAKNVPKTVAKPLILLGLALAMVSAAYLFWGLSGPRPGFVLGLRAVKLAGMLLVGGAVAVATVLFQTLSRNRILTPQIMGFDALYLLLQTGLVAGLGVTGFASLGAPSRFGLEVAAMVALALVLFGTLLGRGGQGSGGQDIPRLILTGVILGVLFRSLTGLVARVLDPNAYAVVQQAGFASFARVDATLLPLAGLLVLAAVALAWRLGPPLDVLALGRPMALSLGLAHDPLLRLVLALVAVLVAVSTALVGPLAFLGLIVAGFAHLISPSHRHRLLLPVAMLLGALLLVVGQTLFERALGLQSALSVVIEGLGGLFFLWLLLKGKLR